MRSVALLSSSACLLETTPISNMKVAGLSFQQETTIYGWAPASLKNFSYTHPTQNKCRGVE
jgi:hypothetical protein